MATLVPPALNRIYDLIAPYLSSDRRGGIANAGSPGYHTSREDLIRQGRGTNYSIQAPADKRGNPQYASGIDITLSDAEMRTVTNRLRTACTPVNGDYDPRIECIREFIGTTDGRNVQGYNRYASGTGNRSTVGWKPSGFSDSSHLWHVHLSVFRDYCDDDNKMRGLAEVIAGQKPGAFGWKDERPNGAEIPVSTYVVQPGDTIIKIAEKLGVKDWKTIAALNAFDPDKIFVGQQIKVPLSTVTPPVDPGPVHTYTVKAGDTLTRIADRFGIKDWRDLEELNPGIDPDRLAVGQVITVPTAEPEPKPEPKPEPEVPKPEPEVPKTVRRIVVSTNMQDATMASSKDHPWAPRRAGYISAVKSPSPDVILVQEATEAQLADVGKALGFNWWRSEDTTKATDSTPDKGPLGVLWNPDLFERTGDGRERELYSNRRVLRVPLKDKESGKVFDAVVSHLDNGSTVAHVRDRQAKEIAEWLPGEPKPTESSPLVFGWDANDKRRKSGPRKILNDVGIVWIRDAVKVTNAEYESHHGYGTLSKGVEWIDDLGVRGMRIVRAGMVRTDKAAPVKAFRNVSDHNIVWAEIEL